MPPAGLIKSVINSHFDEASDCYADLSATPDLPELTGYRHKLHQRLMANLEGLLLSRDYAWTLCRDHIENGTSAEEHFVIAFLAFEINDIPHVKTMLARAFASSHFFKATSDALCWCSWQKAKFWAEQFSQSKEINDRLLGLKAFRYHQKKSPLSLPIVIKGIFSRPQACAQNFLLTEVITDKDKALLPVLTSFITDNLTPDNFELICKCITLGHEDINLLLPFINKENSRQENAVIFAFRRITEPRKSQWFNQLKVRPNAVRLLLIAIGAMADETCLDWVVAQMDYPEYARLAGQSFSLITGIDLDKRGWVLNDAQMDQAWLAYDFDETLDWPDKVKITAWLTSYRNKH
ncbi:hypothetical protein SG34_015680 [Thalassomonas viridans]|uniref:Uncharacterized protein n=1 Tax=Thalassomonas viridans TaxID=137584 RepID=A0AAE9YYV4_9GAMM|nr:hypothetical protein [Thalassomonas viridans]WDE02884.1 hypothetical protein SG34_015680 [Thalassomonas viridans]